MSTGTRAYGYGVATITDDGALLDTYFHSLGLGALQESPEQNLSQFEGDDEIRKVSRKSVAIEIELSKALPPFLMHIYDCTFSHIDSLNHTASHSKVFLEFSITLCGLHMARVLYPDLKKFAQSYERNMVLLQSTE